MKSQSRLGVTIPREHTAFFLEVIPVETMVFSTGESKEFILEIQEIGGKQSVGDLNFALLVDETNFTITYDDAAIASTTGIRVANFYNTSSLVPLIPNVLSFTVTPDIVPYGKQRYLFVAENIDPDGGYNGFFTFTVNPAISAGSIHYTSGVSIPVSTVDVPDLTISSPSPVNTNFTVGQTKDGYIRLQNIGSADAYGLIQFIVEKPTDFTLIIDPLQTLSGATPVTNNTWIIQDFGTYYLLKSTSNTPIISNGDPLEIGYSLTATGLSMATGTITFTIIDGSGGETNNLNNATTKGLNIL